MKKKLRQRIHTFSLEDGTCRNFQFWPLQELRNFHISSAVYKIRPGSDPVQYKSWKLRTNPSPPVMRYNYPVLARTLKNVDQSQTLQIFKILKDIYNYKFKCFILNRHLRIFLETKWCKRKKNMRHTSINKVFQLYEIAIYTSIWQCPFKVRFYLAYLNFHKVHSHKLLSKHSTKIQL